MSKPLIPDYGRPAEAHRQYTPTIWGTISLACSALMFLTVSSDLAVPIPFNLIYLFALVGPLTGLIGLLKSGGRSILSWAGVATNLGLIVLILIAMHSYHGC